MNASKTAQLRLIAATGLVTVALAACSSGSDNAGTSDGSAGVVNGYHLTSTTSFDDLDNVLSSRTLDYNLVQNRITTTITNNEANGVVDSTYNEYYNDNGRLTRRETPDGSQIREANYTFDASGLITTRSISGASNEVTKFEYNDAGNLIRSTQTVPSLADIPEYTPTVRRFTYDESNYLASSVVDRAFVSEEQDVTLSQQNTVYTTDDQGRVVRTERTDTNATSVFILTYRYDDNGNMVERIASDADFYERTAYVYEPNDEPVFNFWLRRFKFFP